MLAGAGGLTAEPDAVRPPAEREPVPGGWNPSPSPEPEPEPSPESDRFIPFP